MTRLPKPTRHVGVSAGTPPNFTTQPTAPTTAQKDAKVGDIVMARDTGIFYQYAGPVTGWQEGAGSSVPDASTTVKGIIEIATEAETLAGSSPLLAVTPQTLLSKLGTPGVIGGVQASSVNATQLKIKTGNPLDYIGDVTLSSGTVTVATGSINDDDRIYLTYKGTSLTNTGQLSYSIVDRTSFTIESTNASDDNVVSYFIIPVA